MALHAAFHADGGLVGYCVSVLHLVREEHAACTINAFLETGAACICGGVALYACDVGGFDLIPAGSLCSLDSLFAAACCCVMLADADEGNLLRCVKVGVDREDRHIRAAYERGSHIALQRCDDHCVVLVGMQVGLDHVLLFVVRGLRGCALHIEHRAGLLGSLFRASHHVLGVLVRGGLEHDGDIISAIAAAFSLRAGVAGAGGRAAAACQHGSHQCGRNKQCADFL